MTFESDQWELFKTKKINPDMTYERMMICCAYINGYKTRIRKDDMSTQTKISLGRDCYLAVGTDETFLTKYENGVCNRKGVKFSLY